MRGPDGAPERTDVPAAIQPHGVLLTVDAQDWTVLQVSANCGAFLGLEVEQVLGQPVSQVLGPLAAAHIEQEVHHSTFDGATGSVLSLPSFPGRFEMEAHRVAGTLVVELEPGDPPTEPTVAGLYRSVRRTMAQMRKAIDLDALFTLSVQQVRALTGMDRVLLYRFDPDGHGAVIAESRNPRAASYLGQHYPASDVPPQARALYLRHWLRQIVDVDYTPVPLVPTLNPRTGQPLAMEHSTLRSVAPTHLQYLRNMGVQASCSISLIVDDQLWGLLACQHDTPCRLPRHVKVAAELLGRLLSLEIQSRESFQAAQQSAQLDAVVQRLSSAMLDEAGVSAGLRGSGDLLLDVAGAQGAVAVVEGERVEVGMVPPPWLVEQIVATLLPEDGVSPAHTRRICDLPGLAEVDGETLARTSGVLVAPVPHVVGSYVAWFRPEQQTVVRWGGRQDLDPPTPRQEVVTCQSLPWTEVETGAARALTRAIPDLLLRQAQERLADHALHDALTGLPNRILVVERLTALLGRPSPTAQAAVLFIDLDRFKLVNDSRGHGVGDAVLVLAAERLRSTVRPADAVGRLGGDEFVVVCEALGAPREAVLLAERVLVALAQPFRVNDSTYQLSASIGVSMLQDVTSASDVLAQADLAMYDAKRAGGNQVATYDKRLLEERKRFAATEQGLRRALQGGELVVHYQPVFAMTGALAGCEALIRWQDPDAGLRYPGDFLPVAEEAGLLDEIGGVVLHSVVGQLARWRADLPQAQELVVSVNVGVRQLLGAGFAEGVLALLTDAGVPAERLCLEVTESEFMADPERSIAVLTTLRTAGLKISIDDFGTGFSSLSYLQRMPATQLKIDQSFVQALARDSRDSAVVGHVIRLAHDLGLTALVEGVETQVQHGEALRLDCDLAQGFLLGRPAPAEQAHWLVDPYPG